MQKRNQDFSVKLLKFYMLTSFILINFFIIRQVFYLASSLSSFYFTKKASPAAKPFLYSFLPASSESFRFSLTGSSVLRNRKRLRSFRPEPFLINQYLINSFLFRPQTADRHKTASATSLCPQSFPAYPPVHEARSLPL